MRPFDEFFNYFNQTERIIGGDAICQRSVSASHKTLDLAFKSIIAKEISLLSKAMTIISRPNDF